MAFTPSNIDGDPGVSVATSQISSISITKDDATKSLSLPPKDHVPDLLPAGSNNETSDSGIGGNQQSGTPQGKERGGECVVVELDVSTSSKSVDVKSSFNKDRLQLRSIFLTIDATGDNGGKIDMSFQVEEFEINGVMSYLELWHAEMLKIDSELLNLINERIAQEELLNEGLDELAPELLSESSVLDEMSQMELFQKLPPKIQSKKWILSYSTGVNGFSLANMYRTLAEEPDPFLLVIQDQEGNIFGAYLTCTPQICESFIGTGRSWLFALKDKSSLGEKERGLKTFHWSGKNDYFFRGTSDNLIIGASDGKFGIFVDGDLHKGRVQACATFDNWPPKEQDFAIHCLECWRFVL